MAEKDVGNENEGRPIVSNGRLRKRRKDGWSRRDEGVFLTHLRATCNVRASARAAGKSASSAFDLRKLDPVFAAHWDETLRDARLRIHGKVIAFAETRGKEILPDEDGEPGEAPLADFDPELGLRLLRFHEDRLAGGRRGRPSPEPVSDEELTAALLRQLDALGRRLRKKKI
jgi:hypothetical protein